MKQWRGESRFASAGVIALTLGAVVAFCISTPTRAQSPSAKPAQGRPKSQPPGLTQPAGPDSNGSDDADLPGITPADSFIKKDDDRRPETPLEKLKDLDDIEALDKKRKELAKPPLEFFATRVAPFDVLPFVKPGHWSTLAVEAQANLADYEGMLQTDSVALTKKQQVFFRRGARLVKKQQTRLSLQIFLPEFRKELPLELGRLDSIRADGGTNASLQPLPPHQMLVIALARSELVHVLEPFAGDGLTDARPPRGLAGRSKAILSSGRPADARSAVLVDPSSHLDDRQPCRLGQSRSCKSLERATTGARRLAPFRRPTDRGRRRRLELAGASRFVPRPLSSRRIGRRNVAAVEERAQRARRSLSAALAAGRLARSRGATDRQFLDRQLQPVER